MKKYLIPVVLVALLSLALTSVGQQAGPVPPIAKKVPRTTTVFGVTMTDNYYWMRERGNPNVLAYLKAENAYTDSVMKPTEPLQEKLFKEMKARIKETDLSVPVKKGNYYYYTRTVENEQYRILCRKEGSLDAAEQVLLDLNQLAAGHDYCGLGVYEVSPDQQLLAYAMDYAGNERYQLRFKDLRTGQLLPELVDSVATSLEWAADNRTVFYAVADSSWRDYRLYRHQLGADPAKDALIYEEPDESFSIYISKSKSEQYLFLNARSETSAEVRFLAADNPEGQFKIICPRQKEMEYEVEHHGDTFLIVTNDQAKNFKLVEAPVENPGKENWKEVIGNRENVKLDAIDVYRGYIALFERSEGLPRIRIWNLTTGDIRSIEFPEVVYSCYGSDNPDYESKLLRFIYMSLVTPRTVYDYDMETGQRELKKQDEVLGGYDPSQYQVERLWATAPDGMRVPVSVVYRRGLPRNGRNPLYLQAYGAYGISSDVYFTPNRFSLLDRGFIFAEAQVRGGGEMGRYWYDDGKVLKKKNTFTDFIAVAEHLIREQYTSPDRLVISGGSAGGLLIGAVLNMRPDLFAAAVADVPFVDLINTMSDPDVPLTVVEYEEWGNPGIEEQFRYMLSYSPYDNVKAQAYPAMLITGGLNDTRVQYWEPAKWTAKLRATKTDHNLLLLRVNMGAGHGLSSGRYDRLHEIAFEYAFLLDVLGLTDKP